MVVMYCRASSIICICICKFLVKFIRHEKILLGNEHKIIISSSHKIGAVMQVDIKIIEIYKST